MEIFGNYQLFSSVPGRSRKAAAGKAFIATVSAAVLSLTLFAQSPPRRTDADAKPAAVPQPPAKKEVSPDTGKSSLGNQELSQKPAPALNERAQAILEHTTWAYPMFKAGPAEAKVITQIDHFPYLEQLYQPAYAIEELQPERYSFSSPEEAMISRTSEMMHADYEGWLAAWDPVSRETTQKFQKEQKQTPESQMQMWRATFSKLRFTLSRRIQTGSYVIVTYRLTAAGQSVFPAEFPVVFERFDGQWYATQGLSQDPLPTISPWINGQSRLEVDVRPLQKEKAGDQQAAVGQNLGRSAR